MCTEELVFVKYFNNPPYIEGSSKDFIPLQKAELWNAFTFVNLVTLFWLVCDFVNKTMCYIKTDYK